MCKQQLGIAVLEAYDGGSHGQFLDGLIASSGHRWRRLGLLPRKWKWRMRGAGIYFAQALRQIHPADYDLIFTSDMTSVSDLKALLPPGWRGKPVVCYFHENQLTYPLANENERDYQFAFTNITSAMAADAVWFNSAYHRDSFLEAVQGLLAKMSDYVPERVAEQIAAKSRVLPLGLGNDIFTFPRSEDSPKPHPPTVLWNHRWEYDKNPDTFFEVLFDLDRAGLDFGLIVLGESFRESPAIFKAAEKILHKHIRHYGYAADRGEYVSFLRQADIVISTSIHEFFGLAVLEAIGCGCSPLLPRRLSYPELIPPSCHAEVFYNSDKDLRQRLTAWLQQGVPPCRRHCGKRRRNWLGHNWGAFMTKRSGA